MKRIYRIDKAMIAGMLLALALTMNGGAALAQGVPSHYETFKLDSRVPNQFGGVDSKGIYTAIVAAKPETPWMRVKLAEYKLSPMSFITFTSVKDGGVQRQTAQTLPQWGDMSCFLNGDAVIVDLHRGRNAAGDYFRIEQILVGEILEYSIDKGDEPTIESICGATDNRVPSSEARPARLTFVNNNTGNPINACSAFPVMNGAMLTAGHCIDFDPDQGGPGLPDGVADVDANDVVEFNPPNSTIGGTLVFAPPDDQYTIDLTSLNWSYNGEGNSIGLDWGVFRCNINPNTHLTPHQAQGFYRMTNDNPAVNDTIKITGYGNDNSSNNQIQQTHSGPYVSEFINGTRISHRYQVDTMGGNSGSPIIWLPSGYTVGIHTNAGCQSDGTGFNSGTSFEHNPLEAALENFPGPNTAYVDKLRSGATENGTVFHANDTVAEGIVTVPNNGTLAIVEGTYAENPFINKPMLIVAPAGSVVIGN